MTAAQPSIVAFTDVDDTLFQTLRKLPHADPSQLLPVTKSRAGEPHSYATTAQVTLLQMLLGAQACLIPVTGRDYAAYQRLDFGQSARASELFGPMPVSTPATTAQRWPFLSWQVLNHGLSIFDASGQPEPHWAEQVQHTLAGWQELLLSLGAAMQPVAERLGCRLTVHTTEDSCPHNPQTFMWVIKHPQADPEALWQAQDFWRQQLEQRGAQAELQVIANANNVSVLPRTLGKAQAVRYLRQTYFAQVPLTLGLGDSISDLPFMQEVDFALTPQTGQLMRALTEATLIQR